MPGALAVVGGWGESAVNQLLSTLDPMGACECESVVAGEGLFGAATLQNAPCAGSRILANEEWVGVFHGDVVGEARVPWATLTECVSTGDWSRLQLLPGVFCAVLQRRGEQRLTLLTDRLGRGVLYYASTPHGVVAATELGTICSLLPKPSISENWLYESLYFGFPLGECTPLRGVKRVTAGCVVSLPVAAPEMASVREYAARFVPSRPRLPRAEGRERALAVFESRVGRHWAGCREVDFALTGGADSRTLLAFTASDAARATTEFYTYGPRQTSDVREASYVARRLGLRHRVVTLGPDFLTDLPDLMVRNVCLSGGLLGVNRATLPPIYSALASGWERPPIFVSGIFGGALFRGHTTAPAVVAPGLRRVFAGGNLDVEDAFYRSLLGSNHGQFAGHISDRVGWLERTYGNLLSPTAHTSYVTYEAHRNYFVGEAAIANTYGHFRAPYWDPGLVKLAYELEESSLGFSRAALQQSDAMESGLFAYLIQRSDPALGRLRLRGVPLSAFSSGSRFFYESARIIRRGPRKVIARFGLDVDSPLEDWSGWYRSILGAWSSNVLDDHSYLSQYLDVPSMATLAQRGDVYWLGKLLTAEIVMRLIMNGWNSDLVTAWGRSRPRGMGVSS